MRTDATNLEKTNLEAEVRTVASFDHPHIIRLLGFSYLDGDRLAAVILVLFGKYMQLLHHFKT